MLTVSPASRFAKKRVIGIDPGSLITGYAVIDADNGRHRHVTSGCLRLPRGELPVRLRCIFESLGEIIAEYRPDEMAVEQVFVSRNPASAIKLGQARGAAICAGAAAELDVAEYSAAEIKQAIVGRGHADKRQIQHMVRVLLNLQGKLQADAADALAVALTHAQIAHTRSRAGIDLRRRAP